MNKAERIFKATQAESRRHVEDWGYDMNKDGGWGGGFIREDTDIIYSRTYNAIVKLIESRKRAISQLLDMGIYTEERHTFETKVITMTERTLANQCVFKG